MGNRVKVVINGETIFVEKGTLLSSALGMEMPCGGRGTCGKCTVLVDGIATLACQYKIVHDIVVEAPQCAEMLSEAGIIEGGAFTENMCLALDIGTTTMALALVSLDEKRTIKVITASNPQRAYGADIMTRIDYCSRHSVAKLQEILIAKIDRMIADIGAPNIGTMYVSGNTTMLHTFFGVDCSPMGVAPYTPAFLDRKEMFASALGLHRVETVIALPSIAAFIGADIVAGLGFVGLPPKNKYDLLVDLGTNAEVVLFSENRGFATSAAAGPCFEGANISCGMSASAGAIYSFEIKGGKPSYKTIGGELGTGICGTGLIDIIAVLLKNDIIDQTGYMEKDYPICEGVYLSSDDVRQYQLAKSAVCSAILSLISAAKIDFDDISTMYISGGFSAKINIENAIYSGLLPKELEKKAAAINNSSLKGTIKYACEGERLAPFIDKVEYVDLADSSCFSKLFVENMMFE